MGPPNSGIMKMIISRKREQFLIPSRIHLKHVLREEIEWSGNGLDSGLRRKDCSFLRLCDNVHSFCSNCLLHNIE